MTRPANNKKKGPGATHTTGALGAILSLQSDMDELRASTAWITGDNAGPRFVVALVILAALSWLPPLLAYTTSVGVVAFLFPPLKSLGVQKG